MAPRGRGRRSVRRRRGPKRGRKYSGARRIPGLVHRVKRMAQTIYIKNNSTTGQPVLTADGNGSFVQATPVAGALNGTWDFTLSSQFMLQCLTQVSDMTNFFDRYKIVGVALKFHYLGNAAIVQQVGTVQQNSNLPTLYYAFDGDDAALNTAAVIQQKGYCKSRVLNANRPTSLFLRPRLTKEVAGVVTPGVTSEKPCWIDCNSSSIPHFGMKFAITDWVGGDINNCLRIQPTYYLQFRDTQ